MSKQDYSTLTGSIFDDGTEITIIELCKVCSVDPQLVDELISEGIIEPAGHSEAARVPYSAVRRTHTVVHLQRDLGVNIAGAALALELLDKIEHLKAQLRRR